MILSDLESLQFGILYVGICFTTYGDFINTAPVLVYLVFTACRDTIAFVSTAYITVDFVPAKPDRGGNGRITVTRLQRNLSLYLST
jgi:hypothetical protein